tara:strand:- start:1566 stop:1874 length:309 start_codon:yes stop_codon:yes gene_type:complete
MKVIYTEKYAQVDLVQEFFSPLDKLVDATLNNLINVLAGDPKDPKERKKLRPQNVRNWKRNNIQKVYNENRKLLLDVLDDPNVPQETKLEMQKRLKEENLPI